MQSHPSFKIREPLVIQCLYFNNNNIIHYNNYSKHTIKIYTILTIDLIFYFIIFYLRFITLKSTIMCTSYDDTLKTE